MVMDSWSELSYPRRLFLWLIGYSLVLMGFVVFFQYNREKEFKAAELNARLQQINAEIIDELESGTPPSPHIAGKDFPGIRISIIDSLGNVVYDNSLDHLPSSNHQSRQEIADAIRSGEGYTLRRHSESTGETYFYSARRGENGLVVRTAVPYSVSLHTLLQADYGFLWILASLTVVMCFLGFLATRRLGQNLVRLRQFAASARRGEKIYGDRPFPHDELGDISSDIVRLYASQQQAIAERDREHAAALRQQQEKERVKKELTNNINHELKTPVAAIRVCLETLLDHPGLSEEKKRFFLDRSMANCRRLESLLDDVATLTRLDEGRSRIELLPLDLAEIVYDVTSQYLPSANEKNISLHADIPASSPFTGNRPMRESIFCNLCSNALASSGASESRLSAYATDNRVRIAFEDDGCGIPAQHLPRIFERFYRIDKGRSRAAGGTGLGLAIVKNSVALHGGEISVENVAPHGLRFSISFPVIPPDVKEIPSDGNVSPS